MKRFTCGVASCFHSPENSKPRNLVSPPALFSPRSSSPAASNFSTPLASLPRHVHRLSRQARRRQGSQRGSLAGRQEDCPRRCLSPPEQEEEQRLTGVAFSFCMPCCYNSSYPHALAPPRSRSFSAENPSEATMVRVNRHGLGLWTCGCARHR